MSQKADNSEQNEGLFEKDFVPLNRSQAIDLIGENALVPKVKTPWQIVKFQFILTIAFTIVSLLINFKLKVMGLELSVFAGALLGVIPNVMFLLCLEGFKRRGSCSIKNYISYLIFAEFIKITSLVTMIILVVRNYSHLQWLPFLVMFILILQSYWMQGLTIQLRNK